MMDYETIAMILGGLLMVSEGLAHIECVRANSIFQLVYGLLKMVKR